MIDNCNVCVDTVQFWNVIKFKKCFPALSLTSRGIRRIRNAFIVIMNQTSFLSNTSLGGG